MISPAWCRMMAAYNSEMNRRFYAATATLDEAARQQPRGAFFGSLHGTLCHLLWADATWMARLDGGAPPAASLADSPLLHADFAPMPAARAALDARIEAWAEGLDEAALQRDLTWHSQAAGRSFHRPMALVVTHLFNHQTHHRGQAHALLTAAGASTGDTDLPLVLA